ncbi:MarR family winged helix-turn-helix transcriptional regulator [Cryptosporangium phraense]|uniref:Winged helix-turn-helix transcriptional regulator n=1 Tax=Cryptosporangium phraense TaxID=2593070 RepID=A0A545AYB5_9ACTN|nr:MarR family winged helix-turn-helix transcriptional regulator [Cryptosporangium phraense]TQS45565.1 winged helix-turn-helix transcriptional regulator [Cryptosporangium phraense]
MASQEACAQLLDQLPAIGEIKRQFHRVAPAVGSNNVGAAGAIPTLGILATEGEQRASDLAERLRVDLSVISRQVATLIEAGMVARATDPSDRRVHRLAITDSGLQTLREHRTQMVELISRGLADWSDDEVVTFARSLRRFADSVASAYRPGPTFIPAPSTSAEPAGPAAPTATPNTNADAEPIAV